MTYPPGPPPAPECPYCHRPNCAMKGVCPESVAARKERERAAMTLVGRLAVTEPCAGCSGTGKIRTIAGNEPHYACEGTGTIHRVTDQSVSLYGTSPSGRWVAVEDVLEIAASHGNDVRSAFGVCDAICHEIETLAALTEQED